MRRCAHEIWALEMGSEVKIGFEAGMCWAVTRDFKRFPSLSGPSMTHLCLWLLVVLILLVKRTTPYQVGLKVARQSIETYVIKVGN